MAWWVYFASSALAGEADTLNFILEHKVLYRPTHTEGGSSRIPHVSALRPGHWMLFVYRGDGPLTAKVLVKIGEPLNGMPGLEAFDRLEGELARAMSERGYPPQADGTQEVIRLQEARPCSLVLEGSYGGRNAIHRVDPVDKAAVRDLIRAALE